MPPLPGPRPETSGLRVLTRTEVTDGVVLAVTVEILQTSRPTDELPPPCPVAERAARGVGNRSRSPRRSRSREIEQSEIESEDCPEVSEASAPVPMPYRGGGEAALVPCRRATVKRPSHKMWIDAQRVAKASLLSEGVAPRGKVRKRAQEVMRQWIGRGRALRAGERAREAG